MKIYINPGHSDRDPGAVGYETERRLNLLVCGYMGEYLSENFLCQVRMNPGTMDSLTAICSDANTWGADLFVSVHFNAGGGDGYEALVYNENRKPLGRVFEKYVLAAGQNSRGIKLRPDLAVLKHTAMPAIVNEGAFVDNWADIQAWNEAAELKNLGIAYAKAAAEYLNLKELYTLNRFVRDVQSACGAKVDGIAGQETLSKTVTLSAYKNRTHPAVRAVQKRLQALGYAQAGEADGIAGPKFTAAVQAFQRDHRCWVDGEITAGNKTWKVLLGLQ